MVDKEDELGYSEQLWTEHFRARRAGKNRASAAWLTACIVTGEHGHLVGPGWTVCSSTDACPGTISYADWIRDHA